MSDAQLSGQGTPAAKQLSSMTFQTRPPKMSTPEPTAAEYPPESVGFYAASLNLPFEVWRHSNPELYPPVAFCHMSIVSKDWPFHIFSKCAHEEMRPLFRPVCPLPCKHVAQGL